MGDDGWGELVRDGAGRGHELRFVRRLDHPPEDVWRALSEPDQVVQWFPSEIRGERSAGGPLRFVFGGDEASAIDGTLVTYDPPSLLELRWGGDELLRFELEAIDAGTRLTLTVVFDELGKAARDAAGWHVCLDVLGHRLAETEPPWDGRAHWDVVHLRYVAAFGPDAATIGPPGAPSVTAERVSE